MSISFQPTPNPLQKQSTIKQNVFRPINKRMELMNLQVTSSEVNLWRLNLSREKKKLAFI